MQNPKLYKALGLSEKPDNGKPVEIFFPSLTGMLYEALGKLETIVAIHAAKIDPEIADAIFPYSEKEKDVLAEPTAAVLNKLCE